MTALRIDGATRLYAIVGDPIAQVRSPEVFSERFAEAGLNAVLLPMHVPASRFDDLMPAMLGLGNLDGVLVTVPFKARMLPFAARVGRAAEIIGAVNALRREPDGTWTGDMFDGIGFANAAKRRGELRGRRVLQFGAGGAGSAIACALAAEGVASIDFADPEPSRVQTLIARLHGAFPQCRLSVARTPRDDFDMIVNASPVGMRAEDGLPGELGAIDKRTLVGDVVITPTPTALIAHATRHGCAHVTGRDMHAGQVDAILEFFGAGSAA